MLTFYNVYSGLGNHKSKRASVERHVVGFTNRARVKQAVGYEWDLFGNKEDFCLIYSWVRQGGRLMHCCRARELMFYESHSASVLK